MAKNSVLRFAKTPTLPFTERGAFLQAVEATQESYDLVECKGAKGMDVDGEIDGLDVRLSDRAFSQLCKRTQIPEAYVRRVAARNESLAMDIVRDGIQCGLLRGILFLTESSSGRVEGLVDEDTYTSPDVRSLLTHALSVQRGMRVTGGWINGTLIRMTATSGKPVDVKTLKPAQTGDLVDFGFEIVTDFGSVGATSVSAYAERIEEGAGLLVPDTRKCGWHSHTGYNIDDEVLKVFVRSMQKSHDILRHANLSTKMFLDGAGVKAIRHELTEGNSPAASAGLSQHATTQAAAVATKDCRKQGEICLWDFVAGVSDAAKHAVSIDRRREIESLSYTLLLSGVEGDLLK